MGDRFPLLLRYGGSWTTSSDGIESYVGGSIRCICVERTITLQQFMQMLYNLLEINNEEFTVRLRTFYMEVIHPGTLPVMPTDIITETDFEGFIAVNSIYMNGGRGQCPLLITTEPLNCGEPIIQCTRGFSVHPFMSSHDSNQVNYTISPRHQFADRHILDDSLYGTGNEITFEGGCSPIRFNNDRANDFLDTQRQSDAPDIFNCEVGLNYCDEESNRTEDVHDMPYNPSSSMAVPSTVDPITQHLPPIPPAITRTVHDALSTTDDGNVYVGQIFSTKQELKLRLSLMAIKRHFQLKTNKSTTDRYELRCVVDSCKWRMRAMKTKNESYFRVTRLDQDAMHTCVTDQLQDGHRQATSNIIALTMQKMFVDASRVYTPRNIIDDIQNEYGVRVSYRKAWLGKEGALRLVCGDPEKSFQTLAFYCHVLKEQNPGTVTAIERDDEGHFLYFFMSIGACIRGFRTVIRPVIAIDGTFLKGSFRGTLLVAAAVDGNDQIYPLAFGIVDSENDASWEWFLVKLRQAISSMDNLVFISDRHNSIEKGISVIFPEATHGFCTYHVAGNVKTKFNMRTRMIDPFKQGYFLAAKVYQRTEFSRYIDKLRVIHPDAVGYLEHEVGFHRWARSHFLSRRYDMMTTNIAESINALLRHARHLPITSLVEFIRCVLQRWFYERREAANAKDTILTDAAQVVIDEQIKKSRVCDVFPVSRYEFSVKMKENEEFVDLHAKTCSCRQFDLQQLPCAHALASCRHTRYNHNSLCSKYYTNESLLVAYAEGIYPVGDKTEWVIPDEIRQMIVKAPRVRAPTGRRKKLRIPSHGEDVVRRQCSRCHGVGHNRATCKMPIPLHSSQ